MYLEISIHSVVGSFGGYYGVGVKVGFRGFSKYVRGEFGGGGRFELLGEGPGGVPLWIGGLFVVGVLKQRIFPTSSSRSSWGVALQRYLMFANSSGVIVRIESLSMDSWGKVLYENMWKGWMRKDPSSMRYTWVGIS